MNNQIEAPKAKRKFSQTCNTKQDFIDLIHELNAVALKEKYDPNHAGCVSKDWQEGFKRGQSFAYDLILSELAKNHDSKSY